MIKKPVLLLAMLYATVASFGQLKGRIAFDEDILAPTTDSVKPKKPVGITGKVKNSKKIEGLFTVYQDTITGSIQLYLRKEQLGKEYIYQSFSLSGPTSLYLNQSMHRSNFIFKVQKAFDKLEFSRVNTSFYYDPNNPISKTKDVDKPEAVFAVERIAGEDSAGYLFSADGIFISEKMDPVKPVSQPSFFFIPSFSLGSLNFSKSKIGAVRSFPGNTDIIVEMAYDNPNAYISGGADITDPRYVRVRMQHSFIEMPKNDFKPRRDDPRVGYFGQQINDQTSISAVPYKDIINRWNLKKKDSSAAISEPVTPIVFWIENTTPLEYRKTIVEAGLKWNSAFEEAGFKNAVQIKIMPDDAAWDPADIRYNVIRWVSSARPSYSAIGPSFVNPRTGEILGADITIEWYSGSASPIYDELAGNKPVVENTAATEIYHQATCTLASELKAQFLTGTTVLEASGADVKEISEMHKQFLTFLILHEMGHTLGLNHNMKGSQMWTPAQINNKELTRTYGLMGSVMDYPAINIAKNKSLQGDYYTTIPGPYDNWAIEYGYKPFAEGEEERELKKILSLSTDPKLAFGNDGDDMRSPGKAIDPRVNVNDLSSDPIGYAEERFQLVNSLMQKLVTNYSKPGQSYAELRSRYNVLQTQRYNMTAVISRYIGGVYVDRSFPDQQSKYKPFTPVPVAVQKRALQVLSKYVFAPNAFAADAPVFAYLQMQRRGMSQPSAGEDFKITATVLHQQVNGALVHILHQNTLQRITNSRLYGNQYSVTDVMTDLTGAIFNADLKTNVNVYRQYLQTSYVQSLMVIMEARSSYDDVAKAAALYTIKKIKGLLNTAVSANEETKAHRMNLLFQIDKALNTK